MARLGLKRRGADLVRGRNVNELELVAALGVEVLGGGAGRVLGGAGDQAGRRVHVRRHSDLHDWGGG